jgi:hypothetical protein
MLLKDLNSSKLRINIPTDWKPDKHFVEYKYPVLAISKSSTSKQENVKVNVTENHKSLFGVRLKR